jgi:hypothetical protein
MQNLTAENVELEPSITSFNNELSLAHHYDFANNNDATPSSNTLTQKATSH